MPPLVSIVSSFYNRAAYVKDCVASLLAQDYPNFEVILIDDGSPDDTLAELQKFRDDRLTVVPQANTGNTIALRSAIARAKGEFIAISDAGDLSRPNRISRQVEALLAHPDAGVAGCWVENDEDDGSGTHIFRPPNDLPFADTMLKRTLFTGGEAMLRRSTYEKTWGYRPFFKYAEDRDLWMQMSEHGSYRIVPEVLYHRRKMAGSISLDPEKQLLLSYLSDFAVQCAKIRRSGGSDPVQRFGPLAAFLREPSENFGRRAAWQAAKYLLEDQPQVAAPIMEKALGEGRSLQFHAVRILCATYGMPLLWSRFSRPILARRLEYFRKI